ncbi:MAG TPA: DUF4965 domain-containing protein [Balneolales bacterium]|nr:DUF4965 domain-containing protein [Balneolales bacterium]
MKKVTQWVLFFIVVFPLAVANAQQSFRPPAYPLITTDPYFSIWSFNDTLYNGPTRHWTGKVQSLQGIIRVDGHSMYFMGNPIPQYKTVLPLAGKTEGTWRYTFSNPGTDWYRSDYTDTQWKTATGAFSDGSNAPNKWTTHDIWVRREFQLKSTRLGHLFLNLHHDDNVTVYLNGVLAYKKKGWVSNPVLVDINPEARATLKKGKNVLAIHCANTAGGSYLDAGLTEKEEPAIHLSTVKQTAVRVTATQTRYSFDADGVRLDLTFTAPMLPKNLDTFSRPADLLTFRVHSTDGRKHQVQLYFSAAGNMAVNTPDQKVVWNRVPAHGLSVMRVGTSSQHVLGRKGDGVRIDWGHLYVAIPEARGVTTEMNASDQSIENFVSKGKLTLQDDKQMPRPAGLKPVTLAAAWNLGQVGTASVNHHLILAYDEDYAIEYFHQRLRPWWKRAPGMTAVKMLEERDHNYPRLIKECDQFDAGMQHKAVTAGGMKYAHLCELAYRQALAACKLAAGPEGKPLFFTKENYSNGDISTVDVIYPTSPVLLYYNSNLLKALMDPIFYDCESGRWTAPYSPHDLGTYPVANGRRADQEEAMPIEESGNMLIMTAAISSVDGNASYAREHWKVLTKWADFLLKNGMDPKNQLTTDDFAGRSAHNANLSVKAIMGIASYGRVAGMLGKTNIEKKYIDTARRMALKWIKLDREGDHYKLTFDRPGTWSQKYNLVWDKILNLNIFPKDVSRTEVAYYLTKQNRYGLPLDSRATYTKSDWITWTATLSNNKSTFEKFIDPLYKYVTETPSRVPMSDWFQTTNAKKVGFQARSVVGGYFIKMLDQKMESKYGR